MAVAATFSSFLPLPPLLADTLYAAIITLICRFACY